MGKQEKWNEDRERRNHTNVSSQDKQNTKERSNAVRCGTYLSDCTRNEKSTVYNV